MKEVESETGRNATDEEIAKSLGISDDELLDWQSQMKITNIVSLNEYLEQGVEIPNGTNASRQFAAPEDVMSYNFV